MNNPDKWGPDKYIGVLIFNIKIKCPQFCFKDIHVYIEYKGRISYKNSWHFHEILCSKSLTPLPTYTCISSSIYSNTFSKWLLLKIIFCLWLNKGAIKLAAVSDYEFVYTVLAVLYINIWSIYEVNNLAWGFKYYIALDILSTSYYNVIHIIKGFHKTKSTSNETLEKRNTCTCIFSTAINMHFQTFCCYMYMYQLFSIYNQTIHLKLYQMHNSSSMQNFTCPLFTTIK